MGPVLSKSEDDEEMPSALDPAEDEPLAPEARERRKMRLALMDRKLAAMEGKTEATRQELDALEKHFRDRHVVLSSTPCSFIVRSSLRVCGHRPC